MSRRAPSRDLRQAVHTAQNPNMTEQPLPEFDGKSARATSTCCQQWGWPVVMSGDRVLLILGAVRTTQLAGTRANGSES